MTSSVRSRPFSRSDAAAAAKSDAEAKTAYGKLDKIYREQIPVVPTALATQYKSLVQEHIAALTSRFSQNRVDYTLVIHFDAATVRAAAPLDVAGRGNNSALHENPRRDPPPQEGVPTPRGGATWRPSSLRAVLAGR